MGFSRGAYTARSVAGLISQIGVLTKRGLQYLPEIYKDIMHRRNPDYRSKNRHIPFRNKPSAGDPAYAEELYQRRMTQLDVPIRAVGVWDTVGSLGAPRIGLLTRIGLQPAESREMSFYDTKLSNCIENAFQALGLDERRTSFAPAVWEKPPGNTTKLRQVWFPGVHSNIGGGYDDQGMANITLAWMAAQMGQFLDLHWDYIVQQQEKNFRYYKDRGRRVRPWSFGKIYDSLSGFYNFGGGDTRTPGTYFAVDPDTGRKTQRPLRDTHEYIHASARTRLKLKGPGVDDKGSYDPEALDDWKLIVEYTPEDEATGHERPPKPNVYWKARFADENVSTRVLPEAPLWGIERALLDMDPKTEEYVFEPPETRNKRVRRKKGRAPGNNRNMGSGAAGG